MDSGLWTHPFMDSGLWTRPFAGWLLALYTLYPGFGTPRGVRVGLVVFSLSLGGHSYGGVGGVPRDLDNRTRGSVFRVLSV